MLTDAVTDAVLCVFGSPVIWQLYHWVGMVVQIDSQSRRGETPTAGLCP